jgi:hypothetical protein
MMRTKIFGFVALLPVVVACSTGSAQAATRNYGLTSFDRIQVTGPFDVHVHVGGSPSARATGPQEAIDRLTVEQHGNQLVIKPLPGGWGGWPGGFHGKLVVDVVAPALSNIILSGSGNVSVDRAKGDQLDLVLSGSGTLDIAAIDVTSLSATLTGSGDVTLAGRSRQARATLTGSGDLKGAGLAVDDATVSLVGSGDLAIGARHTAKGNLAGSGDITIAGPATCSITHSGSGDVHCAHEVQN